MLILLRKTLILIDQLRDLRLCPGPLALDIAQCIKDRQIEIYRRHT